MVMTQKKVNIDDFHIFSANFSSITLMFLQLFGNVLHIERPNFELMVADACAPGSLHMKLFDTVSTRVVAGTSHWTV